MVGWDSDAVLKRILESSGELILVVDLDHKILFINKTLSTIPKESVLGQRPYDIAPAYRDIMIASLHRALSTRASDQFESQYELEGTKSTWVSRVLPILDDGGAVASFVILSRDVTLERRELRQRDRFFALSNNLLCTVGPDRHFTFLAPSFSQTLGYEVAELLSRRCTDFVHPDDVEKTASAIESMRVTGSATEFENRYRTRSGDYRLISWRAIFDPHAQQIYAVGRDMTEKRRLEEQLLQSQKLDAVGQLAGGLAHDFNNIVLAVMMNAEMALRESTSSTVQQSLNEILEAGQRAGTLTRQLLAFSKEEVFEPANLDLREVVTGLHSMIRRLLPESIDIEFAQDDTAVVACVDRGQLEQVIINLCLNARDAMPTLRGTLKIHVETAANQEGELGAMLRVVDNGSGIAPELQKRIFEPFFTTKHRGLGTGLGLSSVYLVLSRHGGRIEVVSAPGAGTEMRAWLPLASGTTESQDRAEDALAAEPAHRGTTILVAEDDPQVRTAVVQFLSAEGFVVNTAADGAQALEELVKGDCDLVLLDLVMPKISGHEVFLRLREHAPRLPVVLSSGYADGPLAAETLADPHLALVRKPYHPKHLLSAIRRLLTMNDEARPNG